MLRIYPYRIYKLQQQPPLHLERNLVFAPLREPVSQLRESRQNALLSFFVGEALADFVLDFHLCFFKVRFPSDEFISITFELFEGDHLGRVGFLPTFVAFDVVP